MVLVTHFNNKSKQCMDHVLLVAFETVNTKNV